ncbi:MAG TPA: TetR/AcrR family transcriptional regulator, partial [Pyrinomonadaceae bacterium]|nr:TetR/AcrR family transcriptional regulator [Pyrinomonadaceae bacterium]
ARQKEELRAEILDAARELFFAEGYDNFSMRKLAERIEYSPTTIYLYFKDKAELFNSLCEETFAKLAHKLETLRRRHETDPLGFFRAGARAYIEFGLKHPHHYTVTFLQSPKGTGDYHSEGSFGERAFNHLRGAVEWCVAEKIFRSVDLDATAQSMWGTLHGVTALLIVHRDFPFVPKSRLIEQTIDLMVSGLRR